MKKALFIGLIFSIFLCGCSGQGSVMRERPEYTISSLGFESENGRITVLMEAVVINSEDTEAEKKLLLLEGSGKTVKEGAENAEKQAVQPVNLSHCGVIVLGKGITEAKLTEICEYCYNRDEINLSAFFIAAQSAKELLSQKPVASIAMGYDIMSRLESLKERSGREYKNRFYQIEAQRYRKNPKYDIPLLKDGVFSELPGGDITEPDGYLT